MASARAGLRARAAQMEVQARQRRLGTRRRSVALAASGLLALAGMFGLVSANVLAVNFTANNQQYKIYTDRVVGQYAAGYIAPQTLQNGSNPGVAQFGFKSAGLKGMCAIVHQDIAGVPMSMVMKAGEPVDGTVTDPAGKTINANELYLAADSLAGNGENISKLTMGQSADTLTMDTLTTHRGQAGAFGLQAELMQIANLDSDTYGIDLRGSINLPDLSIRIVPGTLAKAACTS